ncbi:MAG: hypothetical protein J6X44_08360, partial [Thermoguttaceae bacterium]|nr:hypothetical protein [Thermoguttaceae bacterium]
PMIEIQRTNDPTARAVFSAGATFAELALELGLNAREGARWASCETLDLASLESDEPLTRETTFEIPNVVFLAWFGEWGRLGKKYMRWASNAIRLRRLGYDVVSFDNDRYQPDKPELAKLDFFERLERCSREKALYALYMMGHGSQNSIGSLNPRFFWNRTSGPQWQIFYRNPKRLDDAFSDELAVQDALAYQLGALVVQACESENPNARELASSDGRFWGAAGVYVPRPIDLGRVISRS